MVVCSVSVCHVFCLLPNSTHRICIKSYNDFHILFLYSVILYYNIRIIYVLDGTKGRFKGNMERKSKLKKLKFLYFRPHKRLFGSAESELNGGERSVF